MTSGNNSQATFALSFVCACEYVYLENHVRCSPVLLSARLKTVHSVSRATGHPNLPNLTNNLLEPANVSKCGCYEDV